MTRLLVGLGLGLALCLVATGCGEQPEHAQAPSARSSIPVTTAPAAPSSMPTPKPLPRCGQVWVPGKRFPETFRGCTVAGQKVTVKRLVCESGQLLYTYGRHFYAVGGAPVQRTDAPYPQDPKYAHAHRACTA